MSLVSISIANDACNNNLRRVFAMAAYLRAMGCVVQVEIDSPEDVVELLLEAA